MLVLAGPGSGKTTVITERTKYLIEQGVPPDKILVITYTKAAANEMQNRFRKKMHGKHVPVRFGTFHAVFFTVLKGAYGFRGDSILREEMKNQFFKSMIEKYGLETEDESELIQDLSSEISKVKSELLPLEHYYALNCPADDFRRIYKEYENMLRKHRLIDFDDMLVMCYELFRQREDILKAWQKQFAYILIDEFQDINKLQYEIVRMLAKEHENLFIVGDDDQSIYRFRGARPEFMLNFEEDYKDAKKVVLDVNYRCNEMVVCGANRLISHNDKRFVKKIKSANSGGSPIDIREYSSMMLENKRIVEMINEYHHKGVPYDEMAVLFRTNVQTRALTQKLMEYNIPFHIKDRVPNMFEHWIARDICYYMKAAMGNRERKTFLRIVNRPKRYIARDALYEKEFDFEQLRIFYEDKEWMLDRIDTMERDIKLLKDFKPYAAINYIRKGIGYNEYLKEYAAFRKIKDEELFQLLDEIQESARSAQTFEEWFDYIRDYTVQLKEQMSQKKTQENCVPLMTMHSAKGLEFKVVFIPDANEGVTPHNKAILDADIEEERRMFYVAMTRAKEHLHISYVKERYDKEVDASRFINEIVT